LAFPRFDEGHLEAWTRDVLLALDVQRVHAESAARVLVSADLQGIDSHGVARLPAYVDSLRRGAVAVDGHPQVVGEDGATALVDAQNILGHPAAELAMDEATGRARRHGVGWVAVRDSNHYGIAGYYVRRAAEAGFIGICGTNAGARVAPAGARHPFLGTNPIAFAAPTAEPPMFVFDMATSAVSTGKFEIAAREQRALPEGLGVDRHGDHTRDPNDLADGGWLLPLGSFPQLSNHKGFGLALVVELLSAVLVGGPYGPHVTNLLFASGDQPAGISHFFCALDPGRFGGATAFAETVTSLSTELRALPRDDEQQPVVMPGEHEWRHECDRRANGIPLVTPVARSLERLGEAVSVPLPRPVANCAG
jgi:LDH2 family malate/lactate/ureidoglycolate dehydrogenase